MPKAFDGTIVEAQLPQQPCGGTPIFDHGSGYAYRCNQCNAIIGSVGQSDRCKRINEQDSDEGLKDLKI